MNNKATMTPHSSSSFLKQQQGAVEPTIIPTNSVAVGTSTLKSSEKIKRKKPKNSYSFGAGNSLMFFLNCFMIEQWIRQNADDILILSNKMQDQFEYDLNATEQIMTIGSLCFNYKNQLFQYAVDITAGCMQVLSSNTDVMPIVKEIHRLIQEQNPYRYKHIQVVENRNIYRVIFKQLPDVSMANFIADEALKNDLLDQTISHIQNMQESNGILLYGPPGTGKSLACEAIINEAIKNKISTFFITTPVSFTYLESFISSILAPCIVVLEDCESFARERTDENAVNPRLTEFLQFLSGLSEREHPIVTICTTNHLKMLDDAIKNRPVRINRKYCIDFPSNAQIDQLIDLFFSDHVEGVVTPELKRKCYEKNFTGSHIKEIRRSCELKAKKIAQSNHVANHKSDYIITPEIINSQIDVISEHFSAGD